MTGGQLEEEMRVSKSTKTRMGRGGAGVDILRGREPALFGRKSRSVRRNGHMKSVAQEIETVPYTEGCASTVYSTRWSRFMFKISFVTLFAVAGQFVF